MDDRFSGRNGFIGGLMGAFFLTSMLAGCAGGGFLPGASANNTIVTKDGVKRDEYGEPILENHGNTRRR